jgi:hypothetical protein
MMSRNNPRWGVPRFHAELLKLGIEITETTVAKYMVRSTMLNQGGEASTC